MKRKKRKKALPGDEHVSPPEKLVVIAYKEKKQVQQELRVLAGMLGHGSVSKLVREAVRLYMDQYRRVKKASA